MARILDLQVFSLCTTHFAQGVMLTLPFTVAVYMVRDWFRSEDAVSEEQVGRWTGLLASYYSLAQFSTSFLWGVFSNRYGRKPVLVIGNAVSSITLVWFGLAPSYHWAAAARILGGLLNGTIGAWKCMVGERYDMLAQGQVLSYMSLAWGMGTITGPVLGGLSSRPCEGWSPGLWGCGEGGLLRQRPYLVPCILASTTTLVALVLSVTVLEETRTSHGPWQWWGLRTPPRYPCLRGLLGADKDRGGQSKRHGVELMDQHGSAQSLAVTAKTSSTSPVPFDGDLHVVGRCCTALLDSSDMAGIKDQGAMKGESEGTMQEGGMCVMGHQEGPGRDPSLKSFLGTDPDEAIPLLDVAGGRWGTWWHVVCIRRLFPVMSSSLPKGGSHEGNPGNDGRDLDEVERAMKCGRSFQTSASALTAGRQGRWGGVWSWRCVGQQRVKAKDHRFNDETFSHLRRGVEPPPTVEPCSNQDGSLTCGGEEVMKDPPWYHNKQVVLAIMGYGLNSLLFTALDEVTPIFASTPCASGGLGMEERDLAQPLAFGGVVLMMYSVMGYPIMQKLAGTLPLARYGLALAFLHAFLLPTASLLPGQPVGSSLLLYAAMFIKAVGNASAFTSSMILVNTLPIPSQLGQVNGVGQSVAALVRGPGPALAGWLWGVFMGLQLPGQQYLTFAVISLVALGAYFLYGYIDEVEDLPQESGAGQV